MFFLRQSLPVLLSLGALTSAGEPLSAEVYKRTNDTDTRRAVPFKERDVSPSEMGLRWKSQKRSPLTILQNIQETSVTVVEENLDTINQLQLLAENQFAQLVQAELALVSQVQSIKDNIRVNHFKSRFSSVNTVIVTVASVVDFRDSSSVNNRYLVSQLLADNGFPDKQVVVMVSEVETMTINAVSPTLGLDGIFASGATAASAPTATPIISGFDPNAPFGQLNQSLILPFGSLAPTMDLVFVDPAAIIYPNQAGLFVESSNSFLADCGFYADNGNSFFSLAAGIFTSFNQIALAELAGLSGLSIFGNSPSTESIATQTATETAAATTTVAGFAAQTEIGTTVTGGSEG
jgi:hypothetical protein